jgi:hypothetical protein
MDGVLDINVGLDGVQGFNFHNSGICRQLQRWVRKLHSQTSMALTNLHVVSFNQSIKISIRSSIAIRNALSKWRPMWSI